MTCTAECLDRQEEREREHSVFIAQYPLYCRMCGGCGLEFWDEYHGYEGPGEPMEDVCSACVGIDVCPMCALDLDALGYCTDDDEVTPCPYDPREGGDWEAAPPPYECMCWYRHDLDWTRGTDGGER